MVRPDGGAAEAVSETAVDAQRERIVSAIEATSQIRWLVRRGVPVRPDQLEAAFNAVADAGAFNRAHPADPIEIPSERSR